MSAKYTRRNVPEGWRSFPDGSYWIPDEIPSRVGVNPSSKWKEWGKTTKATLLVGLRVGRRGAGYYVGFKIPNRAVFGIVYTVRVGQVGIEHGASFVQQKGHYIPPDALAAGPERKRREESVQVILYPAPSESWARFKANVEELVGAILDDLGQKSVIAEFTRSGVPRVGIYEWVAKRRR